MTEENQDDESLEGEEEWELEEEGPQPTPSMLVLTEEEREIRRQYRMSMSKCCIEEYLNLYKKLTDEPTKTEQEDVDTDMAADPTKLKEMGVLYDPTAQRRREFLRKKHSKLLELYYRFKETPTRPYLFTNKPRNLPGGQKDHLLTVARSTKAEVDCEHDFSSTFAPYKKWNKVSNLNFVAEEDMVDRETQTVSIEILEHDILYNPDLKEDKTDEEFDLTDIPLDSAGNPIGKTTGFCEWCVLTTTTVTKYNMETAADSRHGGIESHNENTSKNYYTFGCHWQDILPIPTLIDLLRTQETQVLYCCPKYEDFIEEARLTETRLKNEYDKKHFFIDVKSHPHHRVTTKDKLTIRRATIASKKYRNELNNKMIETLRQLAKESVRTVDVAVDTFDLEWDPYESRFKKRKPFNDEVFDDSSRHRYNHAKIVLHQTEII